MAIRGQISPNCVSPIYDLLVWTARLYVRTSPVNFDEGLNLNMVVAFYPGSFDPPHNGHLAVINMASRLFSEVVVGVGVNPDKEISFLSGNERVEILQSLTANNSAVSVVLYDGLTVDAAAKVGAECLLKGVRSGIDLSEELAQAQMNSMGSNPLPTLLVPGIGSDGLLSSRYIRQVVSMGGNVADVVPAAVTELLVKKGITK